MKLAKAICVSGKIIPAGTDLQFANGVASFENLQINELSIPVGAMESDDSAIANGVIDEINEMFPDGFTYKEFADTWPDKLDKKWVYTLMNVDDEHVLMFRTDTGAIEIYLFESDGKYKPDGEFHIASNSRQSAAIEGLISLRTKGTLAIDALTSMLYTVIKSCPPEDRPALKKVVNAAYKAMNGGDSAKTFRKELKLDKLS